MAVTGTIGASAPLRIVQAIASVENPAAGTTYCVGRLARSLAEAGHDVELLSTGPAAASVDGNLRSEVCAINFPRLPMAARLRFSRAFHTALDRAAGQGAILHSNGLWLMPNIYPSWAAKRHGVPLVISPHGMLAPAALQFSSGRKWVFDIAVQRRALVAARCFHATSRQELAEIRAYGLDAPVAVIPNGIDLPEIQCPTRSIADGGRTVLYLGRVHPKKAIDQLISAWSQIEVRHPGAKLRIVGPAEGGYDQLLKREVAMRRLQRVTFEDGLYGTAKTDAYLQADLFVLPTLNENFGMVVGEALAAGTPVVCTRGAPWAGLEEHGCGWWIEHGADPLAKAISNALSMPREDLQSMGSKGRDWMKRDFSWAHIAAEMENVYRWCQGNADRPACVTLN